MRCSVTKKKKPVETFDLAELTDFNTSILEDIKASNNITEYRMGRNNYPTKEDSRKVPTFSNANMKNLGFYSKCLKEKYMPLCTESINLKDISKNLQTHFSNEVNVLSQAIPDVDFNESLMMARILLNSLISNFGETHSNYFAKINDFLSSQLFSSTNSWTTIYDSCDDEEKDYIHFILTLLVSNVNNFGVFLSAVDLTKTLQKKKNVNLLFMEKRAVNENLLKNLYQQLEFKQMAVSSSEVLSGFKSSSELSHVYVYILTPKKRKTFDLSDFESNLIGPNMVEQEDNVENDRWAKILLHRNTWKFLDERKHQMIPNRIFVLLRTFYFWQNLFLKPIDRQRFLLAGSSIKAAYGLRDAQDIDFLVLDHADEVEKYSSFHPRIGVPGIFDDFGKTYYSNEEYYFPMIPEMYEKQKELKARQKGAGPNEEKQNLITNNFPPFSVSGLKIGRYFSIFKSLYQPILERDHKSVSSLDDILLDPYFRINFCGCNLIDVRVEFMRDIIKDIDLNRVSKKQMHDYDLFCSIYREIIDDVDIKTLYLDKYIKKNYDGYRTAPIKLRMDLYHTDLKSEDKVGYGVLIKHAPRHLTDGLELLIRNGPLYQYDLEDDFKVMKPEYDQYYENVLLSSLTNRVNDGKFWLECNTKGQFNIYADISKREEIISVEEEVVYYGQINIVANSTTKKFQFNIISPVMEKISGCLAKENRRDYLISMANLIKNNIQMHKLIDCHTKEKIVVEYVKEKLF